MGLIFKNNSTSRLKIDTPAASATITVLPAEGDRFPQPVGDGSDFFALTIEDRRTGQMEITKCVARSGDIMTVVRAQEGTIAQNFLYGATVSSRPTAGLWDQIFAYPWSKSEADARFVNAAGDTMTGPLTLPGDPVDPTHATTKTWVETLVASVTSLTEAPIDGKTYGRKDADWTESVTKIYVDSQDAALNAGLGAATGDISTLETDLAALEADVALKIYDAPSDGEIYGRLNAGWALSVTATDFDSAVSTLAASINTKLSDAPSDASIYGRSSAAWVQSVLKSAYDAFVTVTNNTLALKAPLASPTFTGNPAAPTPTAGDNDTSIATTAFTTAAVAAGVANRLTDAPSDGLTYGRKNLAWSTIVGGAVVSDAPPAGPLQAGQLWWESDTGNTFIWVIDAGGGAGQWVQQNTTVAAATGQVGEISYFAMSTPPVGFLVADGSSKLTSAYPDLFAKIGYTHGGSGANFNVPQLLGEFIRGWDNGRGVDTGRVFGSAQAEAFADHSHNVTYTLPTGGSTGGPSRNSTTGSGAATFPTTGASLGAGTETRPRNVALLPCIRYLPTVEGVATATVGVVLKRTRVLATNAAFTLQAATKNVEFELQAPGGGSGGLAASTGTTMGVGGGGAGGERALMRIVTPNVTIPWNITIGAAGAAGAASATVAGTGGNISVSDGTNICTAIGGGGGLGATPAASGFTAQGGAGGTGGTGGDPDERIPGQNGGVGTNAGNQIIPTSGSGGDSWLGIGAMNNTFQGPALPGSGYGSGGSGAVSNISQPAKVGIIGRPGCVIVTEYM